MPSILCFGEIAVKDNDGTPVIREGDESRNEMTLRVAQDVGVDGYHSRSRTS